MANFNQHLQTLDGILFQIRYRDPQRIRMEVADILMKPHIASVTPQSRPFSMIIYYNVYISIHPPLHFLPLPF